MKQLARSALITLFWAFSWGIVSCAVVGFLGVFAWPDESRAGLLLDLVVAASLGTVVGFFSGLAYALLLQIFLPSRRHVLVGAVAGASGIIGLLFIGAMNDVAHPLTSNLARAALPALIGAPVAALFGAVLAALDSKIWPQIENASGDPNAAADSSPRVE